MVDSRPVLIPETPSSRSTPNVAVPSASTVGSTTICANAAPLTTRSASNRRENFLIMDSSSNVSGLQVNDLTTPLILGFYGSIATRNFTVKKYRDRLFVL